MQEKNEKISGIMADDDSYTSKIDSLIEKLTIDSDENGQHGSGLRIQPTINKVVREDDQDIEKEITELEKIIKKLQAEIVEMSEVAKKPLPISFCPFISSTDEGKNGTSNATPEMSNEGKEPESGAGFPVKSKESSLLAEQVKNLGESILTLINSSHITNDQKNALDDVKLNFSKLWDDAPKSSKNDLDISEKTIENFSSKLSNAYDFYALQSSDDTCKPIFENPTSIDSTTESVTIESTSNKAQLNLSVRCDNFSEFFGRLCPNDEDISNVTREDDKKMSSTIEIPENSIGNDNMTRILTEDVTNYTINDFPINLNTETINNLPEQDNISIEINEVNIENQHSSTLNTIITKDTTTDLSPQPETVEALTVTIHKTTEDVTSDKTPTPEFSQVIPLPSHTGILEMQSFTCENATENIFTSINRRIRNIVGIGSEKLISKDKNNTEDTFISEEFPRSKSESRKSDESSLNDPMNIMRNMIPKLVSNDLRNDNTEISSDLSDSAEQSFMQANLTTTDNIPINTLNGPQTVNTNNKVDNPDLTKKSLEKDLDSSGGMSSSVSRTMPKYFGTNLNTEGHEESIMKAEIKGEEKGGQGKKVKEEDETTAEQDDDEDNDEEGDEGEGDDVEDDDDDTSTYDVD